MDAIILQMTPTDAMLVFERWYLGEDNELSVASSGLAHCTCSKARLTRTFEHSVRRRICRGIEKTFLEWIEYRICSARARTALSARAKTSNGGDQDRSHIHRTSWACVFRLLVSELDCVDYQKYYAPDARFVLDSTRCRLVAARVCGSRCDKSVHWEAMIERPLLIWSEQ